MTPSPPQTEHMAVPWQPWQKSLPGSLPVPKQRGQIPCPAQPWQVAFPPVPKRSVSRGGAGAGFRMGIHPPRLVPAGAEEGFSSLSVSGRDE